MPAKAFLLICATALLSYAADSSSPQWAYGTAPSPPHKPEPPDPTPQRVPGSAFAFTRAQITNVFAPADWFPGDHPAMPGIIAQGRKPASIWACGLCHYPNGKGRPENAGVSGLPVSYFIHQMEDFRNGLRRSVDDRKKNTNLMIAYAKAMTDDEIEIAATYYAAMRWTPWIRVVETATVPKTRLSVGMYLPLEGNEREPIGNRIIETPEDAHRTEDLRDPRSGFIAYVPRGSVKRGERLAKAAACAACHGPNLNGLGPVPGIAGRSPSYMTRQLYDMQQGARKGEWGELMKPVVEHMTANDMLNLAAYTASLKPK